MIDPENHPARDNDVLQFTIVVGDQGHADAFFEALYAEAPKVCCAQSRNAKDGSGSGVAEQIGSLV